MSTVLDIAAFQRELRDFARARDWEPYHTPKNIVMALMGEAAELGEIFQWLTDDESRQIMDDPAAAQAVRDEVADVLGYVLRLADLLDIELPTALTAKLAINARKYPVHLARGNARKYTQLAPDADDDASEAD